MQSFCATVIEQVGLHARPASVAVSEALKYSSEATIFYNEKSASLKSIVQLMKLAVPMGAKIRVTCTGEDEVDAAQAIRQAFVEKKITD